MNPAHHRRVVDAALLSVLITALPTTSHAYVDPGTGALILQALIAAFFGALFFARRALHRLLSRTASLLGFHRENSSEEHRRPPQT